MKGNIKGTRRKEPADSPVGRNRTHWGEVALVTGASSGIGLELARLLASDGYNLVLVARNRPSLERLAAELRAGHGVSVTVIVQELAEIGAAQAIANHLASRKIEVDILVNNAGTQVYGPFAESSVERQLAMIQVNATAVAHLTRLVLPGMVARGRGSILNIGSTGSFAPGPLNALYCATKAFVLSFTAALAAELAGSGITATALCPGPTATAFATRHGMDDVRMFRHAMSPSQVARIGYRAMEKGRPVAVAGLANQLQVLAFQLAAPFLPITPPAWLMAIGRLFMGRTSTHKLNRILEERQ
jgi:short-subunit dehydrogenase